MENSRLRKEVKTLKAMLSEMTRKWDMSMQYSKDLLARSGGAQASAAEVAPLMPNSPPPTSFESILSAHNLVAAQDSDDEDEEERIKLAPMGKQPGFVLKPIYDDTGRCIEVVAKVVPDFEKRRKKKKKNAKKKLGSKKRKQLRVARQITAEIDNSVILRATQSLDSRESDMLVLETHARLSKIKKNTKPVRLVHSGETLEELLTEELYRGTTSSFYLVNLSTVVGKYLQWKKAFPRVRPHYAIKSNPDIQILRTLKYLGAGFDCASLTEMDEVLGLGSAPSDIIFANPCKQIAHIDYARTHGIKMMTFDSIAEMCKIVEVFPDAHLVIRILPDDSKSLMPFGTKFGATRVECMSIMKAMREMNRTRVSPIQLVGVSFHVGSGCQHWSGWADALRLARDVMDDAASLGIHMTFLDIGGGFPGVDVYPKEGENPDNFLNIELIGARLSPIIDELFPPHIRVISEPGRFFCTAAYTLAVTIVSRRERLRVNNQLVTGPSDLRKDAEHKDDAHLEPAAAADASLEPVDATLPRSSSMPHLDAAEADAAPTLHKEVLYYLSDGVYGSFNNTVFDHYTPQPHLLNLPHVGSAQHLLTADGQAVVSPTGSPALPDVRSPSPDGKSRSSLFGPTCDSIDVICKDIDLPEMCIGDWMYFVNMGAYTVASSSNFNGFMVPNALYIMSTQLTLDQLRSDPEVKVLLPPASASVRPSLPAIAAALPPLSAAAAAVAAAAVSPVSAAIAAPTPGSPVTSPAKPVHMPAK